MNIKLGQMIMTGISGKVLSREESEFIQKNHIGGVLLFSHNYESPAQLAELNNSIQQLRDDYPLFIAVDQEGGRVQRLTSPFTAIPSAKELALLDSPKMVFHLTKIIAQELIACGINTNFAPVCDVVTNPKNKVIGDRAFSSDPEVVTKFVSSVIRGFKTNHLISCAKHFPGHGSTTKDSHYDLPIVKTSLSELGKNEFMPFIKAVKSRVDFFMMAHLIVDDINENLPCSLAPEAYEILRRDLKFQRLIITDDMQMKAITDHYGVGDAAIMAIRAGADIVEYRDMEVAQQALSALQEANKTKKLENKLVNEKFERVQSIKKELLSDYRPVYIPDIQKVLGNKSNESFMQGLREKIDELKAQVSD